MGLFILASGAVHAGNIVNEATTHLEVANMVSQCDEKERLTPDRSLFRSFSVAVSCVWARGLRANESLTDAAPPDQAQESTRRRFWYAAVQPDEPYRWPTPSSLAIVRQEAPEVRILANWRVAQSTYAADDHYEQRFPPPSSARPAPPTACLVLFRCRSGFFGAACNAAWQAVSPRREIPTLATYGWSRRRRAQPRRIRRSRISLCGHRSGLLLHARPDQSARQSLRPR